MKKHEKVNNLDVVFLLDRSGSMNGAVSDTIGGYNSYLKKMRKENALVTTVLFDDMYEVLYKREPIAEVEDLNEEKYFCRGCTALLDAIGKTIKDLDKKHPDKVLFVITTDGLENASSEYSKENIKEMIQGHDNYEFIYLGAGIDSFAEAGSLGIKTKNISNYSKSKRGIKSAFDAIGSASMMVMKEACLDASWKDNIEE